jgi:cob(I)alamin adenosyltransferase
MKIYTRTGDSGETGLFRGGRVLKDAARIEAYGTVDELNATLGVVRADGLPEDLDAVLGRIQNELFVVGAELARPKPSPGTDPVVDHAGVTRLEQDIDRLEAGLEPLGQFILPGGTPAAAGLHLARTVCRRAERRVVALTRQSGEEVSAQVLTYLNRLGDLLFVLARAANAAAGWEDERSSKGS